MTPTEFTDALNRTRMKPGSRAATAACRVLVDGLEPAQAAREQGISCQAVCRAINRLYREPLVTIRVRASDLARL